jgi:hypothetical protein
VDLLVPLGDQLPHDVYHLLYAMVRNILMGSGIYCMHTACVGFRNLNLLIVGHSGHGKTAITCELMRKFGAKLVSGNKTAIALVGESLLAVAGTPTITVGDADSADAGELFGHGLSYGGRLAFAPNGSQCQEPPVRIDRIVLVRLNDGHERFEPLAPESALHRLYPFFMDAVNADVVLCGGDEVYRAKPPQAETVLAKSLTKALRRFPVWTCSGSKRFIVERLEGI